MPILQFVPLSWTVALLRVAIAGIFALALTAPVRADIQAVSRDLDRMIGQARENGWLGPAVRDLERYPPEVIERAHAILKGGGDGCRKAIEAALYLDANRLPTADEFVGQMMDTGLAGDLFGIWVKPDEVKLMDTIAFGWLKGGVGIGGTVRNAILTKDAILNHNRQVALANREAWLQEIVALGLRKGWDAKVVSRGEKQLEQRIWTNISALPKIEAEAEVALMAARETYRLASERAMERYRIDAYPRQISDPLLGELRPDIVQRYKRAMTAARLELEVAETTARATAMRKIGQALQTIAKARVQADALRRYILPVSEGRCQDVRKKGPLTKTGCVGESCAVPADDSDFVPPKGGYWALVESLGFVYEDLNDHECYETRGTVGNGSATFSNAKVTCGKPWGPVGDTATWTPPPAALVPGQVYSLTAALIGNYPAPYGRATLSITMDKASTKCGGTTGGAINLIKQDGRNHLYVGWNQNISDTWSGSFTAPEKSYGDVAEDRAAPRFQIKASVNAGCYRYIYQWRD